MAMDGKGVKGLTLPNVIVAASYSDTQGPAFASFKTKLTAYRSTLADPDSLPVDSSVGQIVRALS